jgi:hypothetical protein
MIFCHRSRLQVLRSAIKDPTVTEITVISRRPLPDYAPTSDKVQVIVLADFLNYPPEVSRLVEHDACIWALGAPPLGKLRSRTPCLRSNLSRFLSRRFKEGA